MDTKMYIFKLDYGERSKEKVFIKDMLRTFDTDTLVGCGIFVNNNPYCFEMLFFVSLAKDTEKFEQFLDEKYKDRKRLFNYFIDDIFFTFEKRGYNVATFMDEESVDMIITEEPNGIFLFPSRQLMKTIWKGESEKRNTLNVFLSHSSKDKKIVDTIFNEIQKSEIRAWYDKYEIQPGDSITEKINQGLDSSDIGIICISDNFLNGSSGWTMSELNFFIQRRMRFSDKTFIIVNFNVPHDKLPPLVQDYKYIDFKEDGALDTLIDTLRRKLERPRA